MVYYDKYYGWSNSHCICEKTGKDKRFFPHCMAADVYPFAALVNVET